MGKEENTGYQHFLLFPKCEISFIFVAFVEDNAPVSSIQYLENHVKYFVHYTQESKPYKTQFLYDRQISVSIALKYIIINNKVLNKLDLGIN